MTENKNQPAFPVLELKEMGDKFLLDCAGSGINKREYFAGLAMQGLLANWDAQVKMCESDPRYTGDNFAKVLAVNSVEFADALLLELSKPQP